MLSIVIPTYNREDLLDFLIQSHINICEKYNIKILISDNASTDNTQEVDNKWRRRTPLVKSVKNKITVTPDQNTELALGIFNIIRQVKNTKTAIIATGAIFQDVMAFYKNDKDIDFDILTCPIWGMDEKGEIEKQLSQYSRVVAVEDHLLEAGFGSWVMGGHGT